MSTDDLTVFLAGRYDEAEALAKAATPGPWRATGQRDHFVEQSAGDHLVAEMEGCTDHPDMGEHDSAYIASVDPAHRLADIALKRAILAEHASFRKESAKGDVGPGLHAATRVLGDVVGLLGTEFSRHPAYKAEWAPTVNPADGQDCQAAHCPPSASRDCDWPRCAGEQP